MIHAFFFLVIAIFPIYIFGSGGLQISHVVLAGAIVFNFGTLLRSYRVLDRRKRSVMKNVVFFVAVIVAVQLAYASILGDAKILLFAAFAILNLIYLYSIVLYLNTGGVRAINTLFFAVFVAISISFGGLLAGVSSGEYRRTSFFNNPNQLGYFALLASTTLGVLAQFAKVRFNKAFLATGILMCSYLALVSLSKAAMISIALCVYFWGTMFAVHEIFIALLVVLVGGLFAGRQLAETEVLKKGVVRLSSVGRDADDTLLMRGYGRLIEKPEYLVFGAGEGGFHRFKTAGELHSTFGTVIFSYGVLGFLFFSRFLIGCFRINPQGFVILFLPVLVYGLTHHGLRFSYFWLLAGIFLVVGPGLKIRGRKQKIQTNNTRNHLHNNRSMFASDFY